MNRPQRAWSVVIFACRESLPQLRQTLQATLVSANACEVIHVLVNGNPALASALAQDLTQRQVSVVKDESGPAIKVWSIPLGDKANAWNQSIYQLWASEEISFFVDGYVRLNADAVELLGNAVTANPKVLGGTGVPTMGRSATTIREDLIANTGYHGNFCCITGDTIRKMREKQIRLPVGLYRTDSLMGAILCYALDPGIYVWEDVRIHVHATASWQIDSAKWWRMRDVQAYVGRTLRQVRGMLENAAFADHLGNRRCSPATLPATAQELVIEWVKRCPDDFERLAKQHLLIRRALRSLQPAQMEFTSVLAPQLVWQHEPSQDA